MKPGRGKITLNRIGIPGRHQTFKHGIKKGDSIKVLLPGERPWILVDKVEEFRIRGTINNTLYHERPLAQQKEFTGQHFETAEPLPSLHDHKQGDRLWFIPTEHGWEPDNRN